MEENKNQEQQVEDTQAEETQTGFDIKTVLENPEFKKFMESYADKRVTDAVKKTEKKYKNQFEEEKKKLEMSKDEILAQKEKELLERELKLDKINYFKEKEYDLDLVDFIVGEDLDDIQEKADLLMSTINKVVDKQVENRLKNGYKPKVSKSTNSMTKEEFYKLGYSERVKLASENPELYKQMTE